MCDRTLYKLPDRISFADRFYPSGGHSDKGGTVRYGILPYCAARADALQKAGFIIQMVGTDYRMPALV